MKTKLEIQSVKPLAWFALNLLIGLGMASLIARPSIAQVTNVDPFSDTQSKDGLSDIFSNRNDSSGASTSVLNLIQRLTTGGTNAADFQAQQQQNLDDAAAQFKAQQRQRIQGQPSSVTPAPIQVVPPVNGTTQTP